MPEPAVQGSELAMLLCNLTLPWSSGNNFTEEIHG